jgi:hypothetical protein
MPHSGSLSAIDFDKSEWEIMYPLFVEEGLVEQERRLMICIFAMIALIFISPTLGVHLHARVCVVFYF